jgi:integrase
VAQQINRLVARSLPGLDKPGRHNDGGGLYLNVSKQGAKSWVFMFKLDGNKRREMGLGSLATVSLADAREKARGLRSTISDGIDPLQPRGSGTELFSVVATDLIKALQPGWRSDKHGAQWTSTLKTHAASLWTKPVDTITTQDVLEVLSPIWSSVPETASRVRGRIERVLDAAKVRGLRSGDNPARWKGHLEVLLPKRAIGSRSHHAAMPYAALPAFVADLRTRPALSARALEFLILTAARTSEVIKADWGEFNLKERLWIVPAERMKAKVEHRVPLVQRAVDILEHVRFMGGDMPFKMSNMGMDMLLRRMGQDDYTVHGFRSSFRDWVGEETDFPREVAEAALAHQVGNEVERAYRRGDALDKRRKLMEAWAEYLTPPGAGPGTPTGRRT